jgi:hypothetical protein
MSEMLESDEDDVPLRGRVRRLNPPRKPPRGEDSSSEEGVTPSAPESSDDGASPPSWGAKRASSDDSDDSEGGVVKRGRRGKAWGPTQPQGGGEDEEEEASDDDASSSKESSGEDEGEDELQHAPCITFREPLRELSAGEAPEDDVSPVPERTERGKRAHSPDSESEDGAPKRGRMGSSLKAAFDWYVTQGYVVHSLEIKTKLTTVGEKKVPAWGGVLWGAARSTFVPSCNSLSIDCGRSSLIVIDVDLPAMDAWAGVEAETGGRCDTFTVRTGNGGLHLYFKAFDDEQLNRTFAKQFKLNGVALDIDVRAKGGCIFAAPSSYKNLSGERRSYVVIKDAAVAEMPQALIAKLKSMLPESSDGGVGRARGRRAGAAADPAPNATGACLGGARTAAGARERERGALAGAAPSGPDIHPVQPRAAPSGPCSPEWWAQTQKWRGHRRSLTAFFPPQALDKTLVRARKVLKRPLVRARALASAAPSGPDIHPVQPRAAPSGPCSPEWWAKKSIRGATLGRGEAPWDGHHR